MPKPAQLNAQDLAKTLGLVLFPTGSNYICDPPVTITDIDYFCFLPRERVESILTLMKAHGWELGGSAALTGKSDAWASLRRGRENIILMWDVRLFEAFLAATQTAKYLNLRDKDDRVRLFQSYEKFCFAR